ncbi:hypothetical protein VYU27_001429 [Nannochloropsis oceanica]
MERERGGSSRGYHPELHHSSHHHRHPQHKESKGGREEHRWPVDVGAPDVNVDWDRERRREKEKRNEKRHHLEREDGKGRKEKEDGKDRKGGGGGVGSKRVKGHSEWNGSSQKLRRSSGSKKEEEEEEEEEVPLNLDEESMRLMMMASGGLGVEDEKNEEERLLAERKRKREDIEALYRNKEGGEGGRKGGRDDQKSNGGSGPAEEDPPASPVMRQGGPSGIALTPDNDDEDGEEDEGPIDVCVHNKPLTEGEQHEMDEGHIDTVRGGQVEAPEKEEFLLDMFSLSPGKAALGAGGVLLAGGAGGGKGRIALASAGAAARGGKDAADTLEDNWDDHEGYYKTLVGEVIADRYLVLGSIGRGVFSTVLRCRDLKPGEGGPAVVAVKIIRNNDVMRKAAQRELDVLKALAAADPENRKHCVRLVTHLEHRQHVVMVFESLQMNLRETLRKFGKHVGLNIAAVRTYAKQLLIALRHIGHQGIVHADIKPDNILVSEGFGQLKLCDFGSSFREEAGDNDPTPYLVSRFYRAPEVVLGFEYGRGVDLWSVGCCLYELFTGRVAFPGSTNNEMLRLMMEVKGGLTQKVVRRHRAAYETLKLEPMFEPDGRFRQQEMDPVTKMPVLRIVHVPPQPTRDLTGVLLKAKAASDDKALVLNLGDLLEKIFVLDSSKRITVRDALHHPFFMSSSSSSSSSSSGRANGGGARNK